MEFIIVLAVVAIVLVVSTGGVIWFWLGLFAVACAVGYRAYRVRCLSCGEKVISGRKMKFCNQCGREQTAAKFRLWCQSCKKIARSELNLNYCNRCGAAVEKSRLKGNKNETDQFSR